MMDSFVSAVWTLILMAPIHFRGSIAGDVMLHFYKCFNEKETHLGWPEGEK